jgi:hypothetical protein
VNCPCGAELPASAGRGRPRTFCDRCRLARMVERDAAGKREWRATHPRPLRPARPCVECGEMLPRSTGRGAPRLRCDACRHPLGIRAERLALHMAVGRPRDPGVTYADHLEAMRRELRLRDA